MKNLVQSEAKATSVGTFLRGFKSGAINSSLMLGIFAGVGAIFGLTAMALPIMGVTVLTTGIFSGILGIKKAKESGAEAPNKAKQHTTHIITHAHAVEPALEHSNAVDTRSDWVERTGHSNSSQSKVQQILANGAMSDKDRASAILAERQNSANSASLG